MATNNNQSEMEKLWEDFRDRFVPLLKVGDAVVRDWARSLDGTTANYITLWLWFESKFKEMEDRHNCKKGRWKKDYEHQTGFCNICNKPFSFGKLQLDGVCEDCL